MEAVEIQRAVALEDRHWWYRERRALITRELRRLGRPTGRALDIGAAGGGNTRVLLDQGWQATAVDFSETAVDLAAARGVPAIRGDARSLPVPDQDCDLVMALDVLEHIEEDHAVAAEMRRVLRPGGTALVSVPCDMRLWSAHDESIGHVRRYTREGLAAVLENAGLRIDWMRSWNVLLRPVVRWRRRKATGCDLKPMPTPVNAALTGIVRLERMLPVGALPGVSLIARARRPGG